MTEACQHLHEVLSRLPRFKREDLAQVPKNGIYVLFEKGEAAHDGDRIVRIGTHRGQNNLPSRIREHLYESNKDRSIFRKHVGRCLLAKASDPFLPQWELDLTAKASRALNEHKVNKARLLEVEADVTRYMVENFSFAVFRFDDEADRRQYEECLLSTIYACPECGPSEAWLGKHHPNSEVIRKCGLWNIQNLSGKVLSRGDAKRVIEAGLSATKG
ncbi:MAG TPA: hypothetical protein VMF32_21090 [Xanthobacteraceae bacterium]|nr:hypothetical protein [Xanthobacteraceae bacterium]HTV70234.1 hypothetical protein [Rhizobiaceae bacterium]